MRSPSSVSIPVDSLDSDDQKLFNSPNAHSWARRLFASLCQYIPGVINPYATIVLIWNKILIFSCLFSGLLDSLFLFLLSAKQRHNCIAVNQTMTKRLNHCLRNVCSQFWCFKYLYCGQENGNGRYKDDPASRKKWKDNTNATACFGPGNFNNGIYVQAVGLTTETNLPIRYLYSLFWGFQQISTMAGNQIPAFFVLEVIFTMFITATGLVLFSLLIGNMQNFLQALGRKSLEMSVRRLDIEQWMSLRQVPEELRKQARESERFNWAATRGLNESTLLENLPEDLQRNIRRHAYYFVERFPTFALMDDSILDAIRERLKHKTYIKGSKILVCGGLVDKMVFIVRGKVESIGEDNNTVILSEGNVCGEELITSCLVYFGINRDGKRIRIPVYKLVSSKMVRCLTNVDAYTLQAADLTEVIGLYSGNLTRIPYDQGVTRKVSAYRKGLGSNHIKLAWRCRKNRRSVNN
ncbi:putative cyclic nucleotide-gated ion channel 20, chloroplastic [Apium graveolens]|uniref:putative cyclic nucleotide-gated ion channel 20, chloroplastic n=1 Tax=Apium graveolens TaxID=4045 RepID=UPI003D7B1DE5